MAAHHGSQAVQEGGERDAAVIWKILQVAESTFRRLKGAELHPALYAEVSELSRS
jgi:hypothetical protein